MNEDERLVQRARAVIAPPARTCYPITIGRGRGTVVTSVDGRRFLDFTSGLAVLNLGHNHPKVMEAVQRQLKRHVHAGAICCSQTTVAAAEELVSIAPDGLDMLFFGNSGTEAVEDALKLARYTTGRQSIIACTGGFHGRTMGALSLTSNSSACRRGYQPLLPSVYHVNYPACFTCQCGLNPEACGGRCLEEIERLFQCQVPPEEVCAMVVEPFLGEGGYNAAPESYLKGLRRICDEYGILLIFDEVQSGVGRTGRWFCCEHAGVRPDIVTVANAVASGFPLGAVVASTELLRQWDLPAHGSTLGGNPVSCAAAVATLKVIREEGLLEAARVAGSRMLSFLQELAAQNPRVGEVRGMGCMIGVEFVDEAGGADGTLCEELIDKCLGKGLILIGCGLKRNVVRLIPPLNVTDGELGEGMAILADVLHELSGKVRNQGRM